MLHKEKMFKEYFGEDIYRAIQEEAILRTNDLRVVGITGWNSSYEKHLVELLNDYMLTHIVSSQ